MKLITDKKSLFVISLSGNLYKISADPDSKSLKIIWEQNIDKSELKKQVGFDENAKI